MSGLMVWNFVLDLLAWAGLVACFALAIHFCIKAIATLWKVVARLLV